MKQQIILVCFFLMAATTTRAQQPPLPSEVQTMQENARQALDRRDFPNAILLLNQAIRLAPGDVSLRRDLAYTYFLSGKPKAAKEVIDPVVSSQYADEQTYQVAAAVESALDKYRNARRILSNGIKKFPHSGLLYFNQGKLYSKYKSDASAFASWRKGIEMDPAYPSNYFAAAQAFFQKEEMVWALIYAETFLNLDPYSPRAPEMKKLMVDAYGRLLSATKVDELPAFNQKGGGEEAASDFAEAFKTVMQQHGIVLRNGINVEALVMLRTRFLLAWDEEYARRYPSTLFSYQLRLVQNGFFDAYNQWLFGAYLDSQSYQLWLKNHQSLVQQFEQWRQNNYLKPASYDPKP